MQTVSGARRSGTQSIERALRILRDVAAHSQRGASLADIAQRCGMDKGTVCRMLGCLVREKVVEQRADKRYAAGVQLFELGLAVPASRPLLEACRLPMERAARQFKGSSFVYLRSGAEVVCIARSDHAPLHSSWTLPGQRRPMPALAAGLAVLSQLPDDEADELVEAYFGSLSGTEQATEAQRREMVRRSRSMRCGVNDGNVTRGLVCAAVPIWDSAGTPFASLSVVNVGKTYGTDKLKETVGTLREFAAQITHGIQLSETAHRGRVAH